MILLYIASGFVVAILAASGYVIYKDGQDKSENI